jgi:hypothetical protein
MPSVLAAGYPISAPAGPFPPVSSWTITRSGSNPITSLPSGESSEQYVPAPLRLASGDIWVYAKGQSRIYAWKSTDDGVTFSIQNGGVAVLTPGASGAWDHDFVLEATVVYDQVNGSIHLWYKANPGPAGTGISWGHATAPDSDPTNLTKDPANPILLGEDVAVALGGSPVADMAVSCVLKIGSTFHFYGYIQYGGTYYLCQTTGSNWNTPTASGFSLISRFDSSVVFETPSVIRAPDGSYLMLFAKGGSGLSSRSILTATAPDGETWTAQTGTVLAPTGSGWEEKQAYSGQFLRSNFAPFSDAYVDGSGRKLFYYSGASATPIYRAGLAYITT